MTHEENQAPEELLRRFVPRSFDVILRLASPVLPSGKKIGYLFIAVFLAVWGAGYYLLESGLWGFLLAIPSTLLVSSIVHARSNWDEWQILRQATASQILRDNTRVALHGHIHPSTSEPFFTPLSGSRCIAYAYEVTHAQTHGGSDPAKRRKTVTVEFEGIGLTPSFVETKHGQVKLLAWPNFTSRFHDFDLRFDLDNIDAKRAADYFRSSLLVEMHKQSWVRGAGESLKADTGGLQFDAKVGELSRQELVGFFAELSDGGSAVNDSWRVKERFIPAGSEVCIIGLYSAERQAIVSDYESSKKQVKLYEGHPLFLEIYYRQFLKAIPILAAITLALIGVVVLLRLS